jgi:hypothetical protein
MTVAAMTAKTKVGFPKPTEGLMSVLKDYHVVRLPHSDHQYNEMLTWCLEHCENKFRDLQESSGRDRAWYFQNPKDATVFALKWA